MSSPTDWVQFYQHNHLSGQADAAAAAAPPSRIMFGEQVSDATVVTTAVTSPTAPTPHGSATSASMNTHLNPDGRVSKPIRRRSRASRRTPTTLLNTDTTNFRAMVQQFTGGPSAPFASGSSHHGAPPSFGFGVGASRHHQVNHPTALMVPPGYQLQFQQQQQQYQQQPQQYMFPVSNTPADVFLQRLSINPRPNMEVSNELVLEGFSSVQVPPRPSSNENRSNNYMF
ncbi:hypothetical protein L1049_023623 [Liquidambar formosana]|uniref:VQ domain-containing protein n=1 Tax=Liquidambar formosana TaxID=63359 RepID=A0AAP0S0C8_LIQFO